MADVGMTVGLIKALAPKLSAEDITTAVDAWLDDHPEATTTVEDGAISYAKLNSSLQGTVDDVADLKSEMDNMSQPDWNQSDSSADDFIKNKPAIRQQANGGGILENGASSASGQNSHAEGGGTTASGAYSHAEGGGTTASGRSSHAEGGGTVASGDYSHAEGSNTTANHMAQHVFGMHNIPDDSIESSGTKGNYVEIVGNGLDVSRRSNARTLDWEGNESLAGGITLGMGTADEVTLSAAQLKQTTSLGLSVVNGMMSVTFDE